MSRQPPEQQAPPVQKLRVRYAKRGRARFTSHRDFSRAFERALRRAGVPMAYSSGFNPHPRISFANASPTGAASEAEYLEIGLAEICDPHKVRDALADALPEGLDVVTVVEATPGALADRLAASHWRIDLPGIDQESLDRALAAFLSADRIEVQRMTKNGLRTFDAREPVVTMTREGECVDLLIRHTVPLVRPDDVLTALQELGAPQPQRVLLTRLAQGPLVDTTVGDPFADPVA